ncbi:hypothetical protein [Halobacillus litoralis]|uniref:hypothetical protein n=1 Tax=Halobacillus litoralis TaxID=45668 RepID=UPI001CFD59FB|nr:hypothetical protein [Halobacillus litoralis]
MYKKKRNPLLTILLTIMSLFLLIYGAVTLFIQIKFHQVKEEVMEQHSEITSIEEVNSRGQWGEFFAEYVMEVKKGSDATFRIWTTEEGDITHEEVVRSEY